VILKLKAAKVDRREHTARRRKKKRKKGRNQIQMRGDAEGYGREERGATISHKKKKKKKKKDTKGGGKTKD